MNQKTNPYQLIDLPAGRRVMISANELNWKKHCLFGLLEVDVTIPRQLIEAHKAQTGEQLSFTGYLAFCLARAI